MQKTVHATVVLLRDGAGRVCLAPKKLNIHKQGKELEGSRKKLNGYGGKQEPDESILQTAIRELEQESSVRGNEADLELAAQISFFWPGNETTEPDMLVHFFFLSRYEGEPKEGSEMGEPCFYLPEEIPYKDMMVADVFFFPKILNGERIVCDIHHMKLAGGGDTYSFDIKNSLPAL